MCVHFSLHLHLNNFSTFRYRVKESIITFKSVYQPTKVTLAIDDDMIATILLKIILNGPLSIGQCSGSLFRRPKT